VYTIGIIVYTIAAIVYTIGVFVVFLDPSGGRKRAIVYTIGAIVYTIGTIVYTISAIVYTIIASVYTIIASVRIVERYFMRDYGMVWQVLGVVPVDLSIMYYR
jgi:hypothetical protein